MAIAILAGKTSTERNKIIAAGVLGVVSLIALYFAFGSSLVGGSSATRVTVKTSPTPKAATTPVAGDTALPTQLDQQFVNETTPVVYNPGNVYAPDAGRNIFAFYEPPPPCKDCPLPTPKPTEMKPATPAPTPPMYLAMVNPQTAYAGAQGFRIEVSGDRFEPNARIYFNQAEMQTTFISPQRLVADIPAGMIAQEGPRQVIIQTPDGKLYSDQSIFNVQAPPKPSLQYVGMIARARGNNDTGVFERQGKPGNFSHRLNDVVDQQFRLISVSREEAVFEDVNLGFKHRLPISKTVAIGGGAPTRGGSDTGFVPFDPNSIPQTNIPGIPNNIPRYVPPQTVQQQQEQKKKNEAAQQESVDDKADE